jgi:hypothetical protein
VLELVLMIHSYITCTAIIHIHYNVQNKTLIQMLISNMNPTSPPTKATSRKRGTRVDEHDIEIKNKNKFTHNLEPVPRIFESKALSNAEAERLASDPRNMSGVKVNTCQVRTDHLCR